MVFRWVGGGEVLDTKHFKGTTALKRVINPATIPIEEKESYKRLENIRQATDLLQRPVIAYISQTGEGDIFELFCTAQEVGAKFLVRTCVDRLAQDGGTTINRVMRRVQAKGTHEIEVQDADGKKRQSNT